MPQSQKNTLYYGDNLQILREHIAAESIDLIYLDPPFNSKRNYNLLFKTPKGHESEAQITAFDDTWRWGEQAEREFSEILHQPNTDVAEMIQSLRHFLKESDVMAYLTMMANRLLEMWRVLKPTGSLYLHCDPTASHYLKVVLDTVFGAESFRNEIVWKRTTAHSGSKKYAPVHDVIFYYSKSGQVIWNEPRTEYDPAYLDKYYRFDDGDGRLYWRADLCAAGVRKGKSGLPWRGIDPTAKGMHWKFTVDKLDKLDAEGRIYWPAKGTMPQYKRYRDELKGLAVPDIWDDVNRINPVGNERLGYPTQKPLALLERIIQASSNPSDVVLDPFCGCGTAVHAAQKLDRNWVGIDITHLAIGLIEKRMKDAFPGIVFEVQGTPKDLAGAADLAIRDKYQFQWWACSLVNAQPYQGKKKGADGGIDGVIYFQDEGKGAAKKIIVSVKGGEHVTRTMVADLKNTVEREKAQMGLFVTLTAPTKPMITEATSAGFYESLHYGAFSKIQILTIEGLLSGVEAPKYPDLSRGAVSFKKAPKEQVQSEQPKLL